MIASIVIISTTVTTTTVNVMIINHRENAYEMYPLTSNLLLLGLLAIRSSYSVLDQLFKANRR